MLTVSANCPHVASVQTGGLRPAGFDGFDALNGPPVNVTLGLDGESVAPGGEVAAASAAGSTVKRTTDSQRFMKSLSCSEVSLPGCVGDVTQVRKSLSRIVPVA